MYDIILSMEICMRKCDASFCTLKCGKVHLVLNKQSLSLSLSSKVATIWHLDGSPFFGVHPFSPSPLSLSLTHTHTHTHTHATMYVASASSLRFRSICPREKKSTTCLQSSRTTHHTSEFDFHWRLSTWLLSCRCCCCYWLLLFKTSYFQISWFWKCTSPRVNQSSLKIYHVTLLLYRVVRDIDCTLVKEVRWIFLGHFWPLLKTAIFLWQ